MYKSKEMPLCNISENFSKYKNINLKDNVNYLIICKVVSELNLE